MRAGAPLVDRRAASTWARRGVCGLFDDVGCLDGALDGLRSDEHDRALRVGDDVGRLGGGEVKVDRHGRRTAEQPAEVGERGFVGILGEHGDAPLGAEIGGLQPVGDAIEQVAGDLPREAFTGIPHGDLVRALGREHTSELRHFPHLLRQARRGCCGSRRTGPSDPGNALPRTAM